MKNKALIAGSATYMSRQPFPEQMGIQPGQPWAMQGQPPPTVVIHNQLQSQADANAIAKQENSQVSSVVNTIKVKIKQMMSNPLVTAAIAAAATLLLHNKLPFLKGADAPVLRIALSVCFICTGMTVLTGLFKPESVINRTIFGIFG